MVTTTELLPASLKKLNMSKIKVKIHVLVPCAGLTICGAEILP